MIYNWGPVWMTFRRRDLHLFLAIFGGLKADFVIFFSFKMYL